MNECVQAVCRHLMEKGVLSYEVDGSRVTAFQRVKSPQNGMLHTLEWQIEARHDGIVSAAVCGLRVPPNSRRKLLQMSEFITLVNCDLPRGAFELNMKTGEIRFRVFIPSANEAPSGQALEAGFSCQAQNMSVFLPGILHVLNGTMAPGDAMEFCLTRRVEDSNDDDFPYHFDDRLPPWLRRRRALAHARDEFDDDDEDDDLNWPPDGDDDEDNDPDDISEYPGFVGGIDREATPGDIENELSGVRSFIRVLDD